jgi:hypothetical protein
MSNEIKIDTMNFNFQKGLKTLHFTFEDSGNEYDLDISDFEELIRNLTNEGN